MSQLWVFTVAVVSHWQSYLTGGLVTGLISLIERVVDWKMPRKWYLVIFVGVFLLVSFFLAWRDQYQLAIQIPGLQQQVKDDNKTIQDLKDRPPQIQVSVPQQQPRPAEHLAQITFGDITLSNSPDNATPFLTAERQSAFNIPFGNVGPFTAKNTRVRTELDMLDTKPPIEDVPAVSRVAHGYLTKFLQGAERDFKRVPGGLDLYVGRSQYNTVGTPVLSQADIDAIYKGNITILVLAYVEWNDSSGKETAQLCNWLQRPIPSNPPALVWHSCE